MREPVPADALDRVTWALRRADMSVLARKDRRLRSQGLAASHYSMLISIHADPGLTGAELARRLNVTPQAVASLIARLEERAYLERRSHPRHRQVQEVYLTDTGREVLRRADEVVATIEHDVVAKLGPERTKALTSLLAQVIAIAGEIG